MPRTITQERPDTRPTHSDTQSLHEEVAALRRRVAELEHALYTSRRTGTTRQQNEIRCQQTEAEFYRRGAILEAVGLAAEQFLNTASLKQNIEALLERLGEATDVCRIYVFQAQQEHTTTTTTTPHAHRQTVWVNPSASECPMLPHTITLPPRWNEQLRSGTPIYATRETLSQGEQTLLEHLGGHSMVVVPIFVGARWWGFIGFDETRSRTTWSPLELDAVKAAAGIIGAAIQRYHVEFAIQQNEREIRKLYRAVEQSPHAIIITSTEGVIEYVNPRFTDITGYQFCDAVGQRLGTLQTGCTGRIAHHLSETMTTGNEWRGEMYNQRKDGTCYWESVSISSITNAHNQTTHFLIVKEDITERKQEQEQLVQQQRALAILHERERMARELHDNIGQVLGFVNIQAQTIRALLGDAASTQVDAYLERLMTTAQEAQADVREFILGVSVSGDMHASENGNSDRTGHNGTTPRGLLPSLEHYIQQVSQLYHIPIALEVPNTVRDILHTRLSPSVGLQLLRIIQEALTNARRHAGAHALLVSFDLTSTADSADSADRMQQLRVMVEDDGTGFDVQDTGTMQPGHEHGARYGLRSMYERAEEIGAHFEIESSPGQGTRVILLMPLSPPDAPETARDMSTSR